MENFTSNILIWFNYITYGTRNSFILLFGKKNEGNNKPANFATKFTRPIVLDNNHEYAIGLNRIFNMSFTWFNVNPGNGNQLIRFSSDSRTNFTNISFPPGVWNYSDFNSYMKQKTVIKSPGKDDEYPITFAFYDTIFKLTIILKTKYHVDLTKFNLYELIGFDKKRQAQKY